MVGRVWLVGQRHGDGITGQQPPVFPPLDNLGWLGIIASDLADDALYLGPRIALPANLSR